MKEYENICNHILESKDIFDFQVRFNYLLHMVHYNFQQEIFKKNHLPFKSFIFIEKINYDLNIIIDRLNKTKLPYKEGIISEDIFMLILKEDYPEYYKNYIYQVEHIKN